MDAIHDKNDGAIERSRDKVLDLSGHESKLRDSVKVTIAKALPNAKTQDRDYIFLNFVLSNLPHGIIGLLLAVMFSAAMSSMASELNALASTTVVDIYKRNITSDADPLHYVKASKWFTILWALLAMVSAMLLSFAENLIQFVNIVGSLFYGTIPWHFPNGVLYQARTWHCGVLGCITGTGHHILLLHIYRYRIFAL